MDSWRNMVAFPLSGRSYKPRKNGLTMVLDKGLGLGETNDLLGIASEHIDIIKLGFGTSALYGDGVLQEKVELIKSRGIDIYPGGTFFELAVAQGKLIPFLNLAKQIGFSAIEVSDGTINLDQETRFKAITLACDMGFKVFSEVGKKDPSQQVSSAVLAAQIEKDIEAGASRVIIEGREFGTNVTLYDGNGMVKEHFLNEFLERISDPQLIIWEAPLKQQQQELILRFGPDVNLGNIAPQEILSLEALRVGLRGDTLRYCIGEMS